MSGQIIFEILNVDCLKSSQIMWKAIGVVDCYFFCLGFSNRKKGKKEGKKAKKESVLKDAIANAKLWETKLDAVEKSRQEYR